MLTIFLLVGCLLIRMIPRVILKDLIFSDTYFHLGVASDIRRRGMKVPDSLSYFILPNKHRYPFLFHWLWALLPKGIWRYAERFFSAIADTFIALLFWLLIYYFGPPDKNVLCANWTLALYAISPGLLRTGDGPRAYNMSPRLFGVAVYIIHLFMFYKASLNHDPVYYLLSATVAALLFFTAIFSVQALLFIAPGIAVFYDYHYALVVIAAFLISVVLSFGKSPGLFLAAWRHSVYYSKVQSEVLYPRYVTFLGYLRTVVNKVKTLLTGLNLSEFLNWYTTESNFVHLIITMFTPVVVVALAMTQPEFVFGLGGFGYFSCVVFFSGFLIFVITKHKPFLFLGSGERYLEYIYGFGLFICSWFLLEYDLALVGWIILAYGVVVYIAIVRQYISGNRQNSKLTIELNGFLSNDILNESCKVLPLNANHSKLLHYYCPDTNILVYQTIRDEKRLSEEEFARLWPRGMNYPTSDLQYVIAEYGITHIFCKRTELDHYLKVIFTDTELFYRLFSVAATSENYCILKRNNAGN